MKKILSVFIFISCIFVATPAFAATVPSAEFLDSTLWYAPATFAEGDTVQIHTALWNDQAGVLTVKVEFTDGTTLLGSRTLAIPTNTLKDVSVSWKVTTGDHTIGARIASASTTTKGKTTTLTLSNTKESTATIFVPKKSVGTVSPLSDASVIPVAVTKGLENTKTSLDGFRAATGAHVSDLVIKAQKKLDALNAPAPASKTKTSDAIANSSISGTEKPIAYVELFLLQAAAFILNNAVVFYGLLAVIVFLFLRAIFLKIKNR